MTQLNMKLQTSLKENNLVIIEAKVNGIKTGNDLSELADSNDIENISLIVGTPGQVMFEGLETAMTYLPILQTGLTDIAVFLQEGREGEGISKFIQAVTGLEWLGKILSGAAAILDEETLRNSFKSVESYSQKLAELLEGWENRDYVLIADLLEYEIVPFIEEMMPLIKETLDKLREKE